LLNAFKTPRGQRPSGITNQLMAKKKQAIEEDIGMRGAVADRLLYRNLFTINEYRQHTTHSIQRALGYCLEIGNCMEKYPNNRSNSLNNSFSN